MLRLSLGRKRRIRCFACQRTTGICCNRVEVSLVKESLRSPEKKTLVEVKKISMVCGDSWKGRSGIPRRLVGSDKRRSERASIEVSVRLVGSETMTLVGDSSLVRKRKCCLVESFCIFGRWPTGKDECCWSEATGNNNITWRRFACQGAKALSLSDLTGKGGSVDRSLVRKRRRCLVEAVTGSVGV